MEELFEVLKELEDQGCTIECGWKEKKRKKDMSKEEEDTYGLNYLCCYLENFVDTAKISIAGVMTALANDEKLDPFCKYLMFTHLYSPEEIAEIDREELLKEKKRKD